jgi:hypothetical protein
MPIFQRPDHVLCAFIASIGIAHTAQWVMVSAWRVALEARAGCVSINVRITAVRKLAVEAADNGRRMLCR